MKNDKSRSVSPEWITANRRDRIVVPEIKGGWRSEPAPLTRGSSFTDWKSKTLSAPIGDSVLARGVRYHELIHTLVSPASIEPAFYDQLALTQTAVEVSEEMRVNQIGLKGVSGDISDCIYSLSDGTEQHSADFAVKHNDWVNAVALMTATYGTGVYRDVKRRLRKHEAWKDNISAVDKTLGTINKKLKLWEEAGTTPEKCGWTDSKGHSHETVLPSSFLRGTLPLAQAVMVMMTTPPTPENKTKKSKVFAGLPNGDPKISWQLLKMGMSKLTQPSAKFIGRKKIASVTGKSIRHPERLFTDPERRLFSRDVKGAGGVLVVDCSGSMRLSHEDLCEILRLSPGCTVIGYSSGGCSNPNNCFYFAKNGKRVSENHLYDIINGFGGGNGVDLPALVFANRHRTNKKDFLLWISDGWVTGEGDEHSHGLVMECVSFLEKANGVNVRDAEEAIGLLKRLSQGRTLPKGLMNSYLETVKYEYEQKLKQESKV